MDPPVTWRWEIHTIAGDALGEVQAKNRRLTLTPSGPGSASMSFNLIDVPAVIPSGAEFVERDLIISDGDSYRFSGQILAAPSIELANNGGQVTFAAAGIAELLQDRYIQPGTLKEAMEATTIAWQLVEDAQAVPGGDLRILPGVLPDTVARTKQWDSLAAVKAAIDELASMDNGFDWSIEPDPITGERRFNCYAPRRGTDRGVVLEYGGNVTAVSAAVNAGTGGGIVNLGYAVGANGVTVAAQDNASTERYRLREAVQASSELDDATVLGDKAAGLLTSPKLAARLTTIAGTVTLDDVEPGDTVEVDIDHGWFTYHDTGRVEEITVTWPGDGDQERLELVVAL